MLKELPAPDFVYIELLFIILLMYEWPTPEPPVVDDVPGAPLWP